MKVTRTLSVIALITLSGSLLPVWADNPEIADCKTDISLSSKTPDKDRYEYAYSEAECFRLAAAQIGAEWLKTGELLQESTEQAARQNWDEANELVEQAQFQAIKALQQAAYESEAWKYRVVK